MSFLFTTALLLVDLPGQAPTYAKPVGATRVKYFEFLEDNTHIIYPAIAILAVALIAWGVISAWRTEEIDGLQKAELKRELIRELRREVWGMTVESLAKNVGLPPLKVLKLLEEMLRDNIVESRTDTRRVTTWKMRGLSNS